MKKSAGGDGQILLEIMRIIIVVLKVSLVERIVVAAVRIVVDAVALVNAVISAISGAEGRMVTERMSDQNCENAGKT